MQLLQRVREEEEAALMLQRGAALGPGLPEPLASLQPFLYVLINEIRGFLCLKGHQRYQQNTNPRQPIPAAAPGGCSAAAPRACSCGLLQKCVHAPPAKELILCLLVYLLYLVVKRLAKIP